MNKLKRINLNTLTLYCGFFGSYSPINNFYNCDHPQVEDSEMDNELGREVGKCLGCGCPVAYRLYEEDGYSEYEDMMEVHALQVIRLIEATQNSSNR